MIVAFVGTPGSGKTYDAVKKIIDNLRSGRRVYTNIEGMDTPECQIFLKDLIGLDDYEFNKLFNWVSDKDIERFWEFVKDGSLILIDEIHKRFSNRDWNSEKNKHFAEWCSTHRHLGCDVVFITQDMEKVEKHVRSLIEWTYVYRKVNFLGSVVKNRYIKYSFSGDDASGKPLSTNGGTYDNIVFKCYKSYSASDAKEIGFMTHVNVLKHPVFFVIPCILAGFLYMVFNKSSFASGDLFGTHASMLKKVSALKPPVAPVPRAPAAVAFNNHSSLPVAVREPLIIPASLSVPVSVVGFINAGLKNYVLLSDGRSLLTKRTFRTGDAYVEKI